MKLVTDYMRRDRHYMVYIRAAGTRQQYWFVKYKHLDARANDLMVVYNKGNPVDIALDTCLTDNISEPTLWIYELNEEEVINNIIMENV